MEFDFGQRSPGRNNEHRGAVSWEESFNLIMTPTKLSRVGSFDGEKVVYSIHDKIADE